MAEKDKKEIMKREDSSVAPKKERPMIPPVDIYETKEALILVADMPGVSKNNIDIKIEENVLEIRGKIGDLPAENVSPLYAEVGGQEYLRAFTLGPEFDLDKVEATMEAGTLRIFLPKIEAKKPKKIEIKVA